jgi:hypothetical protein
MATVEQVAELRRLINEPDDTNGWTDEILDDLIDANATLNASAKAVWVAKASTYSTLVDVSESGSSRKLGDLYKNALAMAKMFGDQDDEDVAEVVDRPVIARIRRGFA